MPKIGTTKSSPIVLDRIYNENCLDTMKRMPDCFVDLVVTSPPYDQLRDYKGYSFEFEKIAAELVRTLKQGGVIVWVINDQTINGSETGTSFRHALFFKSLGLNLHDKMIWTKDGGGAVGSNLAYHQNFEYMFVLSKGQPKTVNLLRDKRNGSYGKYILGERRNQEGQVKPTAVRKPAEPYSKRNNYWHVSRPGNIWHPAIFPFEIAYDHIRTWSAEGDVVYDPCSGSGTTAKAAKSLGRRYLGSEISKEYWERSLLEINHGKKIARQLIPIKFG